MQEWASKERPNRPGQLMMDDLRNATLPVRIRACNERFGVLYEATIERFDEKWSYGTKHSVIGDEPFGIPGQKFSLADDCLIPYQDDSGEGWNPENWIEWAEPK